MVLLTIDVEGDLIKELARADNEKLTAFLAKLQSTMIFDLGYTEEQAEVLADKLADKISAARSKKHKNSKGVRDANPA